MASWGGTYGSSALQPDDDDFNYNGGENPNVADAHNSKITDISSRLKNAEQADSSQSNYGSDQQSSSGSNPKIRDISSKENSPTNIDRFNYNPSEAGGGEGNNSKKEGKIKKGAIGFLIALVMGGGMFFGAGLLTGPAQLLQVYNFFQDTYNTVHHLSNMWREARNIKSLATSLKATWGDSVADANRQRVINSRVGAIDQKIAKKYADTLAKKGIFIELDTAGRPKAYIDPAVVTGNSKYSLKNPADAATPQEQWRRRNAIERANNNLPSDMENVGLVGKTINADNPNIRGPTDTLVVEIEVPKQTTLMGQSNGRKFLTNLNELADIGNLPSWIGKRAWAKQAGYVNALFHLVDAKKTDFNNAATDKIGGFLDRLASNDAKDGSGKKLNDGDGLRTKEADAKSDPELTEKGIEELNTNRQESADNINSALTTNASTSSSGDTSYRAKIKETQTKIRSSDAFNNVAKGVGVLSIVIGIFCAVKNLADSGEAIAWFNNVVPAMKAGATGLNMASQMMAGDLDMDDIGSFVEVFLYDDEYPVTTAVDMKLEGEAGEMTSEGVETTEYITSSFWDACIIRKELGEVTECSEASEANIPIELADVKEGNAATKVFDKVKEVPVLGELFVLLEKACTPAGQLLIGLASMTLAVLSGDWLNLIGGLMNFVPGAVGKAGQLADTILDGPLAWAMASLGPLMGMAAKAMNGDELEWRYSPPEYKANVMASGNFFSASMDGVQDGGAVLNDEQQHAWNREVNTYLARKWDEKPLTAKLFDPTDYRSAIAKLGRNAGINPNPSNITEQFANTFKMFAALPRVGFASFFNSPAQAAMAASGAVAHDYGAQTVAMPMTAINFMNDENNESTEIYNNAAIVGGLIQDGSYDKLIKTCFGKKIDKNTLAVSHLSESEMPNAENGGITFRYMAVEHGDYKKENCAERMNSASSLYDENFVRIAHYVGLDWNILNSHGCYYSEGGGDESCAASGMTGGGSSGSNSGLVESYKVKDNEAFNLRMCTDGVGDGLGDVAGSNTHQSRTAYLNQTLGAGIHSYVVVPLSSTTNGKSSKDMLGYVAKITDHTKGTSTYAVVGDQGPARSGWGEVSVKAAWNLGYTKAEANGRQGPNSNFTIEIYMDSKPDWTKDKTKLEAQIQEEGAKRGGS